MKHTHLRAAALFLAPGTTELMALRDPSVNARYHYNANDERYRERVAEVIVNSGKRFIDEKRALLKFYFVCR